MLTIEEITKNIAPVCKKYDVKSAYLFGSYSRGEATEASDIDIRIQRPPNSKKLNTLLKLSSFSCELEDVLHKEVQVITGLPAPEDEVNEIFRENVLRDEVLLYDSQ